MRHAPRSERFRVGSLIAFAAALTVGDPPLTVAATIDTLGQTFVRGISADGQTVVGGAWRARYETTNGVYSRPSGGAVLRWSCSVPRYGAHVDGMANAAADGEGLIVGRAGYETGFGEGNSCAEMPGLEGDWPNALTSAEGQLIEATAITPDGEIIVGVGYTAAGQQAFRVAKAGVVEWLGTTERRAIDVSADGKSIVGGSSIWREGQGWTSLGFETRAITPDGNLIVGALEGKPALWTEGSGIVLLSDQPGLATGVSADGSVIVGEYGQEQVFLWTAQRGMQDLEAVLRTQYGLDEQLDPWAKLGFGGIPESQLTASETWPVISDDGRTLAGTGTIPPDMFNWPLLGWRVQLDATPAPLPGDANGDQRVDLSDFGVLKINFGAGRFLYQGDFNADYQVDLNDFAVLKSNFGQAAAAVPEPSTLLLSLLAMSCCAVGCRMKCD